MWRPRAEAIRGYLTRSGGIPEGAVATRGRHWNISVAGDAIGSREQGGKTPWLLPSSGPPVFPIGRAELETGG